MVPTGDRALPLLLAGLLLVTAGTCATAQAPDASDPALSATDLLGTPDAASTTTADSPDDAPTPTADGIQDAVGGPNGDGTYTTYTDPFCAGYAVAFVQYGGDKAMAPDCPGEPLEPLSMPAYKKGERAGKASARAFLQFRKEQQATKARTDGHYLAGFYDKSLDAWIIRQPDYPVFHPFEGQAYATIHKDDDTLGLIDKTGLILIPVEYDAVGVDGKNHLFRAYRHGGNKTGLYDARGNLLLPAEYDDITVVDAAHLLTRQGDRRDLRDRQGKLIFSSDKDLVPAGEDRYWYMEHPQRWGILDEKGQPMVAPEFTYPSSFKNGKLTSQKADGEDYVIYRDGRVVKLR